MNEREKLKEIIETALGFHDYYKVVVTEKDIDRLADKLIENGYGDVSEWKRRAEVAERNEKIKERALDKATELAYEFRTEADTLSCSSCPMPYLFDSCKERGLYKECSKRWKEEILRQAEREIEEERK